MSEGAWLIEVSERATRGPWGPWGPCWSERPHWREVDAELRCARLRATRDVGTARWRARRYADVGAAQACVKPTPAAGGRTWTVGLRPDGTGACAPGASTTLRWRALEPWRVLCLDVASPPSAATPWWDVLQVDVGDDVVAPPRPLLDGAGITVPLGRTVRLGQAVVARLRNLTRRRLRPWATLALLSCGRPRRRPPMRFPSGK